MSAVTRMVANELAAVPINSAVPLAARHAETSAMLRFGGGVQSWSGLTVVTAVFGTHTAAVRLRGEIVALHGLHGTAVVVAGSHLSRVQVVRGGAYLARRVGLLDAAGKTIPDLNLDPNTCTYSEGAAVLRAAFLARGQVSVTAADDGRSDVRVRVSLACPGPSTARWLVAYLRRCGITAHRGQIAADAHTVEIVQVRKSRAVGDLLLTMGAPASTRRLLGDCIRLPGAVGAH